MATKKAPAAAAAVAPAAALGPTDLVGTLAPGVNGVDIILSPGANGVSASLAAGANGISVTLAPGVGGVSVTVSPGVDGFVVSLVPGGTGIIVNLEQGVAGLVVALAPGGNGAVLSLPPRVDGAAVNAAARRIVISVVSCIVNNPPLGDNHGWTKVVPKSSRRDGLFRETGPKKVEATAVPSVEECWLVNNEGEIWTPRTSSRRAARKWAMARKGGGFIYGSYGPSGIEF